MKKLILTSCALAIATGAFAQGAVSGFGTPSPVVSVGVGKQQEYDSSLYSGSLTMTIYFSTSATTANISALNALNGTSGGGAAAQALLAGDGFTAVSSAITLTSSGESGITAGFGTANLSNAFAPSTVGYFALVFTGAGATAGYSDVIGSGNGTSAGGNYGVQTPGTPYNIGSGSTYSSFVGSPGFNDIDLTTTPSPEPTTVALAGLGGLALLGLRRRK